MLDADGATKVDDLEKLENQVDFISFHIYMALTDFHVAILLDANFS